MSTFLWSKVSNKSQCIRLTFDPTEVEYAFINDYSCYDSEHQRNILRPIWSKSKHFECFILKGFEKLLTPNLFRPAEIYP